MSFRRIAAWLILAVVFSASLPFHVKAQQPYILAAEDVLEVVVFGNADVSRAVTIRPDGMISLPLIGEVAAAGLTPEQLRRQLTQLFASFLRNPQVAVIVREFQNPVSMNSRRERRSWTHWPRPRDWPRMQDWEKRV